MKYAVDRIENSIAILENVANGEKKEVPLEELPDNIKEGNILIFDNENFVKDEQEEIKRRENIKNRFNRLRKK